MSFPDLIQKLTLKKMEKVWMHNLAENLSTIRKAHDISEIPKYKDKSAIVIGAGPSIKHKKLALLRKWNGAIFAADRMLLPLLRRHVIPDFVVTVDGSEKITGFYKHPLVQQHISDVKAVLSCQTTHPNVSANIPLDSQYYFTSLWDNPLADISITRIFQELTDKKILQTGGNAGSCAFFLAYYLDLNPIGLLGIDFAYNTLNVEDTLYYQTFKLLSGGDSKKLAKNYRRTTTWAGKRVLTDLMFLTYYKILVPQLKEANVETFNLGEYSILPETVAEPISYKKFLKLRG